MLRFACWVFLVLSIFVKQSTSGLISHKIAKRAACPPGGGDQSSGCESWSEQNYCHPDSIYHQFMKTNCPASCGLCEAVPTPPPVGQVVAVDSVDCLDAHNSKRNLHINTPNMVWDDSLAQASQAWSLKLANEDQMYHSDGNYGENLAYFGATGKMVKKCRDAVNSWYDEEQYYDWDNPGNTKVQGEAIGHFTQVVWKSSTKVGCGAAKIQRGYWVHLFITCRYTPPGNFEGAYSSNVLALTS